MTKRIFLKLIFSILVVLMVALVSADYLVSNVAEENYRESLTRNLREKARILSTARGDLARIPAPEWQRLGKATAGRITLVARDGTVIADSSADASHMENHGGRPEVQSALQGADSWIVRRSPTLGIEFLYVAIPVKEGALRVAVPIREIRERINNIRLKLAAVTALAFVPALALAGFLARHFSSRLGKIIAYSGRLASGDFHARLQMTGPDELGVLSDKLNETAGALEKMFRKIEDEQREMQRLDRVRKDFLINVSHELRTPLASIQGYTETLLDGALHDEEHNVRFLTIIRQNAERLGRLIADLMTISSLELRTQRFQLAGYPVNTLLNAGIDSMQPLAEKKRVALTLEKAPAEAEVFCDAEAVHQVLVNLIENALNYTPEGGSILVAGRTVPPREGRHEEVEISVRDSGIGIPAEDQPRLFERFYRVDKARSRVLGGTGLGLAIVKHLVMAHDGEVGVHSELGKGSTFFFTLPIQDLGLNEPREVQ
ncbi:MAG: HAMP domain-containing protein [Acidobacteriia bacterium]|nr:HAMP domain-containing protein [Terriglobia bacterium]